DTIGSVKVLDVTQDADFTFVHTDQPGGFPTVTTVDGRLSVRTSIQSMQITNCSGAAPEMAQFSLPGAQNKSEYTYFKKAYTGTLTGPAGGTGLRGNATSIVIEVVTRYTGIQPTLFFHPLQFDNGAFANLVVDVRTAGRRVITPANVASN